ncbi:MAG TPA: hypothetical protein VF820_05760 [Patescibacteria group bacterium]
MDNTDSNENNLKKNKNAYKESLLFKKLLQRKNAHKPLKIAFLDIDSTLTGDEKSIKQTKIQLKKMGYQLVFVTARTEEMVMSEIEYKKSKQLGFSRPKPYVSLKNGKYVYKDPAKENNNFVNPDIIIGSTGTQILIKQSQGGYIADTSFEKLFGVSSKCWREQTKKIIAQADPKKRAKFATIEFEESYKNHISDIYPPKYRIKLLFKSILDKKTFISNIKKIISTSYITRKESRFEKSGIRIIDESNTLHNKFAIYITPALGNKGNAVNHVVTNICQYLKISQDDIHVILAGDSYPDLAMLFYGAKGTNATAILVGGSRLSNILITKEINEYAGEDLSLFKNNMQKHKEKIGYFYFTENLHEIYNRNIVIGDLAYPHTKGPATLLAFLNQSLKN